MMFNKSAVSLRLHKIGLLAIMLLCGLSASAQESADKILAVVGRNRIILQSDLETVFAQKKQDNPNLSDTMRCQLLQQMVLEKMLIEQADRDSVIVSDEDVDGQLDNRIRYFTQLYGSKEKLEQISGKTVYQMKEEFRDGIKDELTAQKMQQQILEPVKISPSEVQAFYNKMNVDSLPVFPASVEVGQIVIDPPVTQEMQNYAHDRIADIRKQIVTDGKSFETMAGLYSDDPGSRDNGGRYDGVTRTGAWAPEFVAAAFKLQNGEISPIIKTKFGYHIIQMINRKGDEADLRHILIHPEITTGDYQKALDRLDSIRTQLVEGKIKFPEAVGKFSTDEAAQRTGGMIAEPTTGATDIDMSKLDPGMVLLLDSMKVGGYSAPHIYVNDAHERSCRIVFLRSRTDPHKANLKDDYSKLMEVALQQKKNAKMQQWVISKLPSFYLKIDNEYQKCGNMKDWQNTDSASK